CHNGLGEWEKAATALERYRALLGDEAYVCGQLGLSYRGLQRWKEAQAAYRKALDLDPKDQSSLEGLLMSLSTDEPAPDIQDRLARMASPAESFDAIARTMFEQQMGYSIGLLCDAMAKIDAKAPQLAWHDAVRKAWWGQAQAAVER